MAFRITVINSAGAPPRTYAGTDNRRDLVGRLLLTGIEHTDSRPWIGFVGLAVTIIVAGVLEQLL